MPRATRLAADIGREIDAAERAALPETELPTPPPGTTARVRTQIEYQSRIDTDKHSEDLRQLAAQEMPEDEEDLPIDPLFEFLEQWAQYANGQYNCLVYRLPDSGQRRQPGNQYRRPYFGPAPENLGVMTFDTNVAIFISDLQALNQYSGGSFQIQLVDIAGRRVPGAVLYTCTISDPASVPQPIQQQSQTLQQVPPLPREHRQTEEEKEIAEFRRELMRTAMQKLLNPQAPTAPTGNGLSPEDQAKLYILNQGAGNLIPSLFTQMMDMQRTMLEQVRESTNPEKETWKERAISAAVGLAESNPQIVERLSGTLERVLARVLPLPGDSPAMPPYYPQQPQQQLAPPPQYSKIHNSQSEAPQQQQLTQDQIADMTILNEFITLLGSDEVLSANHPVFKKLHSAYPVKFKAAAQTIASVPLDSIYLWISSQHPTYAALLNDPVNGPYLKERVAELQQVFQKAINEDKAKKTAAAATAESAGQSSD